MLEHWTQGGDIARFIDHTLLKAGATEAEIGQLCEEARQHGFYSVCVNGGWVDFCREQLAGSSVKIAAVAGFPLGANASRVKALEAAAAVHDGAAEIDMVLPVGLVLQGRFGAVSQDVSAVVKAVEGSAIVKVILETALLDDRQIAEACRVSEAAGAHYVKTSTGFGPGGATEAHVRLMRASVYKGIGVKASGGIRDTETAIRMLEAGANRLGTSAGVAITSGAGGGSIPAGSKAEGQQGSSPY